MNAPDFLVLAGSVTLDPYKKKKKIVSLDLFTTYYIDVSCDQSFMWNGEYDINLF